MRLLALALFICSGLLFAQVPIENFTPQVDQVFIDLGKRALDIDTGLKEYNERCTDTPDSKDCVAARQILNAQQAKWIVDGLQYRSQGDDCRSKVRTLLVNHTIRLYTWNLGCMGRPMNDPKTPDCLKESEAIDREGKDVLREIDDCKAQVKPKL